MMTVSNFLSLVTTWLAGSSIIVTAAVGFQLSENNARRFSEQIRTNLLKDPRKWAESINSAFLTVFDYVYGSRGRRRDRGIGCSCGRCTAVMPVNSFVVLNTSQGISGRTAACGHFITYCAGYSGKARARGRKRFLQGSVRWQLGTNRFCCIQYFW